MGVGLAKVADPCYRSGTNDSIPHMARICDRCERGSNRGFSRSHSNIATKREQFANLQTRRIGGTKMKRCTRCLKSIAKTLRVKVGTKKATA